jgi:DNA-binding NarL/FixJ family response regulator
MSIRITITDDHPLVVSGLKKILQSSHHIEVVATYSSGKALLDGLKVFLPDVILTDLQMPGKVYGIDLIRNIRATYPQTPILILSGQEALFNVQDMMAEGCMGYLLKNATDQEMLVQAIEQVYKGELYLEPLLKNELLREVFKIKKERNRVNSTLSRREKEVLVLIAKGYSSQQIADELFLSIRTIDSHRISLLQKLNVKNVATLLRKALATGLIK